MFVDFSRCGTLPMSLGVLLVLLLHFRSAECEEPEMWGKVGSEIVLSPDNMGGPIKTILWRKEDYLAMEHYGDTPFAYEQFKERGSLNTGNGELTIKGLTFSDSGLYKVEINGHVNKMITLRVIAAVPKPHVSKSCHEDYCNLSCEGKTVEAEPVSYIWILDQRQSQKTDKDYKLTKDENVKSIHCELENPVSSQQSDPIPNPLPTDKKHWKVILGVVLGLLFVLCLIIFAVLHVKGILRIPLLDRICPAKDTEPSVKYDAVSGKEDDAASGPDAAPGKEDDAAKGPDSVKVEPGPSDDPTQKQNGTEPRLLSLKPLEVNDAAPGKVDDAANGPDSVKVERPGPSDDPNRTQNGTEVEVSADVHPNTYKDIGPAHEDQPASGRDSGEAPTSSDDHGNADADKPDDGEPAPDEKPQEDEREDTES